MGLAISVGSLASALESGSEEADWLRSDFREVNRILAAYGLPLHQEPEVLPAATGRPELRFDRGLRRGLWLSGMPYAWLHYLRRAVAYAKNAPAEFRPCGDEEDPTEDEQYDYELLTNMRSHVICHSDVGGFYVPIDFPEPLYDDREDSRIGGILGSSQGALRELIETAPLLGIRLRNGNLRSKDAATLVQEEEGSHPYWIERHAWLYFSERLRESIALGSAVDFG